MMYLFLGDSAVDRCSAMHGELGSLVLSIPSERGMWWGQRLPCGQAFNKHILEVQTHH